MSSEPSTKKARSHPTYELLYWPGIPGRGEFIRLAFESQSVPYKDVCEESSKGMETLLGLVKDEKALSDSDGNPPVFAPPALRVPGAGKDGKNLLIYQTPNILSYIGDSLGLTGEDEVEKYYVQEITLAALDLNNETHDTHHPVAVMKYYEEQKEEALKKATDFRENRVPKFLGYFERVLKGNKEGAGKHLVGKKLTYADTTVWHVADGLQFAFPNEMKARAKEFPLLFDTFYPSVKEQEHLKAYLTSDRRKPYSMGVFRHYPELDRQ